MLISVNGWDMEWTITFKVESESTQYEQNSSSGGLDTTPSGPRKA